MKFWVVLITLITWMITFLISSIAPQRALGGVIEVSVGGSYNRSSYSEGNYSWMRRWGASLGYHLSEMMEIEIAFQDVFHRTRIAGYEDTSFHDAIYSANWVQTLLGKNWALQPYVKAGIGQLNRDASGTYAIGGSPPIIYDAVTGIIGAGARLRLSRSFGIRGEATSYLTGANINTWQDNFALTLGLSFMF